MPIGKKEQRFLSGTWHYNITYENLSRVFARLTQLSSDTCLSIFYLLVVLSSRSAAHASREDGAQKFFLGFALTIVHANPRKNKPLTEPLRLCFEAAKPEKKQLCSQRVRKSGRRAHVEAGQFRRDESNSCAMRCIRERSSNAYFRQYAQSRKAAKKRLWSE